MTVQTVLIPYTWDLEYAIDWLVEHGYKFNKVDQKGNYWRFRQVKPNPNMKYYTYSLSNGVKIVNF
jgi:hypothetical protein